MALTYIELTIANPAKPRKTARVEFQVDSGAAYTVVPRNLLRRLGVRPHSQRKFILADGSKIKRPIGDVVFRLDNRKGAAPVIFGAKGDSTLLGSTTLEALGFILDPLKRELRPLPMLLAPQQPLRRSAGR